MIKLIATDLDGTLLNNHSQISDGNNEAIKKAKEKQTTNWYVRQNKI